MGDTSRRSRGPDTVKTRRGVDDNYRASPHDQLALFESIVVQVGMGGRGVKGSWNVWGGEWVEGRGGGRVW